MSRPRTALLLALTITTLATRLGAQEPLLDAAGPAAAPWWPPVAPGGAAGVPMKGWAMAEGGPMFMAAPLQDMVYGAATSLPGGPRLQGVLRGIWEHLAVRVNDLADMESKAALLTEETDSLRKKGVGGEKVLDRLTGDMTELWSRARERSEELRVKFEEVLGVEGNLRKSFPTSRNQIGEYFDGLRLARRRVEERYRSLGKSMDETRRNLETMERRRDRKQDQVARARPVTRPEARAQAAVDAPSAQEAAAASTRKRWYQDTAPAPPEDPPGPGAVSDAAMAAISGPDADLSTGEADRLYQAASARPEAASGFEDLRGVSLGEGAGGDTEPTPGFTGDRMSARELIRKRLERLRRMGSSGKSIEEIEAEVRNREAAAEVAGGVAAEPREAPDADELIEDFLGGDGVMDPYLSKRPAAARGEGSDRDLGRRLDQMFARREDSRGAELPRVRPPPEVNQLGTFATHLESELQLAARTEGLDDTVGFGGTKRRETDRILEGTKRSRESHGGRSVQSILSELEALEH